MTNVTKSHGSFRVLNNVTLNIAADETLAILGPNGAGTTTLVELAIPITRFRWTATD